VRADTDLAAYNLIMSIHKPANLPLSLLDFEILHLKKEEHTSWRSDAFETVAVLIEGACSISSEGQTWELERRTVFLDIASAVFASPAVELSINAHKETTLALCKARADTKFKTAFISQEQVTSEWRGDTGFKRKVSSIVHTETRTQRIAVGETINESGEWSSFPPHKHDVHKKGAGRTVEAPLEEIYYFRLQPETGFGFQRLYTRDGSFDEAYVIQDGDVTLIPSGYHPVANMPGHELYYLWMLAGEERAYLWNTDPAFQWMEKIGEK
jgi:5-deoxy-glucuronate isomerase